MMRMHHAHVPVRSDSRQEEGTSSAVHGKHEEADVAEKVSKHPLELGGVVAGPKGQSHVEQKISHCQVEEQHCAALPGPHVEAKDPESQAVTDDPQNKLCHQQWREHTDQNSPIEMALHLSLCAVCQSADQRNKQVGKCAAFKGKHVVLVYAGRRGSFCFSPVYNM